MAYICKKPNREGKYYVFLVESYRENGKPKQRTLKNYGSLEALEKAEPGAFERLRAEIKSNSMLETISKNVEVTLNLQELNSDVVSQNVGYSLLNSLYESLNLSNQFSKYSKEYKHKYDLDKILRLLVFMRVLNPASKSATVEKQKELFGDWNISQNDMDRALDHFPELKHDIQLQIHKSISENIGRTATLVFYDVTNYYFETDIQDDIRKRGPSKEHRPKPIVQMGLFMDSNGIPISYELFVGNCVDPKTYMPAVEQVKKQFGIQRIVTVADKAMNSMGNVTDAYEKGDGWLFSSKFRGRRGAPKDLQNFALDEKGWKYNLDKTFASKSMIRKRKLANGKVVAEKVLVTWKLKYAVREKYKRLEVLKVAQKMTKSQIERQLVGKGIKKFMQAIDPETGEKVNISKLYGLNYEQVEFDEQFDGMNIIVTSETNMLDEEMLTAYGQLNKIEDCFRVTKTSLNARPVFVWTKEHIEAHFLTCFIALVLIRLVQYKINWKYGVGRIINTLRSANVVYITQGYYKNLTSETNAKILKEMGIKLDASILKAEQINKIMK